MHCLPHRDAAIGLVASSSGRRVGYSFCSNRNLIVKIKAHVFLKYQLGVVDCLGSFSPHTYTIRGMGKSYMREEKEVAGTVGVKCSCPLEEDADWFEVGR